MKQFEGNQESVLIAQDASLDAQASQLDRALARAIEERDKTMNQLNTILSAIEKERILQEV